MFDFLKNLFTGGSGSYQNLDNNQFAEQMTQADTVILDVRTPGEFASGRIPKAINIDVTGNSFTAQIAKLDPQKNYLVYCRSGMRSAKACGIMAENGFTHLFNLSGGISSWTGNVTR